MLKSNGSVLIAFVSALPLITLGATLCLGLGLAFAAKCLLHLDVYRLARAHLYGKRQDFCAETSIWPKHASLKFRFRCSGDGQVQADLSMPLLEISERLDLRPRGTWQP